MVADVPLGAGRACKIMTRGPLKVTTQLSYIVNGIDKKH